MNLVKSAPFGSMQCDFYSKDNEIWMTREQIGTALEYANPSVVIGNIHKRHKDRLDKFSTFIKLIKVEGNRTVERDATLYTAKGVYEICRWSKQPKADAFFDFVYEILEGLRKGELELKPNQAHKQMELEANLLNAKTKQAELLVTITEKFQVELSKEAVQSLIGHATGILSGQRLLPEPTIDKTFTAKEIADIAGVSANKVGRTANKHNLKTEEYGIFVLDKSRHSNKQVSSFRYNQAGRAKLLELLQGK